MTVEELFDEFEFLGGWDDRCDYLIDLGFDLPPFPDELRREENRVRGCQSNVWMTAEVDDSEQPPRMRIQAHSDAMIVNGLIAVLLMIFQGRTPRDILRTDVEGIFHRLELDRHLSSQRKNGLFGMVTRIRDLAALAQFRMDREGPLD